VAFAADRERKLVKVPVLAVAGGESSDPTPVRGDVAAAAKMEIPGNLGVIAFRHL
jgi:hypothetical protein